MKQMNMLFNAVCSKFTIVKNTSIVLVLSLWALAGTPLSGLEPDRFKAEPPDRAVRRVGDGDPGRAPQTYKRSSSDVSSRMGTQGATRLPSPPTPSATPDRRAPRLAPMDATLSSLSVSKTAPQPELPALATSASTLILYDTTGPWGFLGELYAQQTANLVSRFGSWKAAAVGSYVAGQMNAYTHVVYIGSTYDEPLPLAFLADVRTGARPVIWMYDNLWQLTAEVPDFATVMGWTWTGFDFSAMNGVLYKGTLLERDALNGGGIMGTTVTDATKAEVPALAQKTDGTTLPWAIRSGYLLYLGEVPFSYVGPNDRYLAFADLLYTMYAPATPTRHRALVRIEDVGPDADPAELKAVADLLYARRIPFSVAVYPAYRDPNGVYNGGVATSYDLAARPGVVSALKYMQSKGGTLLMHGYTHQFGKLINPYSGASADDFEFYTAHIDSANNVVYDGPVPGDSQTWAAGRITSASKAFTKAGLTVPTIFELPHYAASVPDYKAIRAVFTKRYDRGLYFGGLLTGGSINYARLNGQFFPYPVRDLYGFFVIPENLGNVEPEWFNNHPPRFPSDILYTAQKNLVIRDGFASFFYHPYLGTSMLRQIVDGLSAQGWTFVSAGSVAD